MSKTAKKVKKAKKTVAKKKEKKVEKTPLKSKSLKTKAEETAVQAKSSSSSGDMATESASTDGANASNTSASFKNFRHHPDMENFYRFIYENDLRFEALQILDMIMAEKKARKRIRAARAKAH